MVTQSPLPAEPIYRFASFELDATLGILRKHGYRVPLQEQPFRILCLMLERPFELITREQIREKLWAADIYVDFDRSLNKAMVKLRQALDDDADAPVFIETLPKRGYRFLLPVEIAESIAPAENSTPIAAETRPEPERRHESKKSDETSTTAQTEAGRREASMVPWLTRGLAVAVCLAIVWLLVPPSLLTGLFRQHIDSMAVLPLQNLSGDPSQDYFAEGMTDEVTTTVARIPGLRVVSRSTMNQYRGKQKTIREIGRELNVDAVLEGSVVRSGEKVRITVQLVDARRDSHLWAQSYEPKLTDIVQIQDAIAVDVASQVRTNVDARTLGAAAMAYAAPRSPVRPNAYDDFLRGRSELAKQNPESMKKAAEYFKAAIDDDPQYARAYAGLADSYNFMANYQVLTTSEAYPQARAAALKALELDPNSGEAHAALALVKHHFDWDWPGADAEYQKAVQLQPNYAPAHHRYAWFLTDMGLHGAAVEQLRVAEQLDPQSIVVATNLGRSLYRAGRYDEALLQLKKAVATDPNRLYSHVFLSFVYEAKQMCDEALAESRTIQGLTGGTDTTNTVHVYASCGRQGDARKALALLAGPSRDPIQDWTWVAADFAALGDKDQAFQWLERAFENHDFYLTEIKTHPYFDPLRSDARFQKLLDRLKFSYP